MTIFIHKKQFSILQKILQVILVGNYYKIIIVTSWNTHAWQVSHR